MYVLGLHTSHDVSGCLIRDGEIRVAIELERISRTKHEGGRGRLGEVADYCLATEGIGLDQVDIIVVNDVENVAGTTVFDRRETLISHHLAHAWACIGLSDFERAAVLIVDGEGSYVSETEPAERALAGPDALQDYERESAYLYDNGVMTPVGKWTSPHAGGVYSGTEGIGAPYWRLSHMFFGCDHQESKVMGLTAYAPPSERYAGVLALGDGGAVKIDPEWYLRVPHMHAATPDTAFDACAELAASIQLQVEEALLHRARWLHSVTGVDDLCYGGGVALNCVANARLAREGPFRRVFVPFGPSDSSIAIGCAFYGWSVLAHGARSNRRATAYLGRRYQEPEVDRAIDRYAGVGLVNREGAHDAATTAAAIASGEIVAWFQEGSEFGPRALGHRSLLADPRDAAMHDHINRKVKYREPFRPFAPIALDRCCDDWFSNVVPDSRFMQFIATVRPERREQLRAITHVDGTARIQVLARDDNPTMYELIEAFAEITGIPVLLNTSFNVAEPIVESPDDAIRTFLCSRIDRLIVDGKRIGRRGSLIAGAGDLANVDPNDLFIFWHEDVELVKRFGDDVTHALQRLGGTERYTDSGYHMQSFLRPEIAISPRFAEVLESLRPRRGALYAVNDAPSLAADRAQLEEFFNVICGSRIASLVVRSMSSRA